MARPRAVPRMVPITVASGVMIKMSLAPTMTRDSTSRPSGSVPNQCAEDGAVLAGEELLRERVVRCQQVPEDGTDHPEQQDARAGEERRLAQQQ